MQLRSALLAATVLATPIAASAQPVTGLYVGAIFRETRGRPRYIVKEVLRKESKT